MLADTFVIQFLLDVLRPFPDFINRCKARKARTQAKMNELWVMRADIYLAFRVQLAGKMLVLACMFGSAIPLLFLIGACYAAIARWVDRRVQRVECAAQRKRAPAPATQV